MTDAIIDSSLQLDGYETSVAFHVAHPLTNQGLISLTESYKTAEGMETRHRALSEALESLLRDDTVSRPVMAKLFARCPDMRTAQIGLEHFTDTPSKVNYRASFENIFTTIKNTIVAFVKKVIDFIKRTWTFLKDKALELTGFKNTADVLIRREIVADHLKEDVKRIAKSVGVENEFTLDSYFSQIPKDATNQVQLAYIKGQTAGLKGIVDQAETLTPILQEVSREIPKLSQQVVRSRQDMKRIMGDLRREVARSRGELDKSYLNDVAARIELAGNFTDGLGRLNASMGKLLGALEKGDDQSLVNSSLTDKFRVLASEVSGIRTEFKNVLSTDENLTVLNTRLATFLKGSLNATASIDVTELSAVLKEETLSVSDAELVESLGNPAFLATYTRYVTNIQSLTAFTMAINNVVKALRTNISSLGQWHQRVNAIVTANLVTGLDQYRNYIDGYNKVTGGKLDLVKDDAGQTTWELTKYDESLDDFKLDTITGMGVQQLLKADIGKVKSRTNNLLRSMGLRTI